MRTFAIGDIHGNYKGLLQCLERVKFDYKKDKLICLGDVCDGRSHVKDCFNELLKIKNLIYILGNHDDWALDWYLDAFKNHLSRPNYWWTSQGGNATLQSYNFGDMDKAHVELLDKALLYYEEGYNLFVHGGIGTRPELLLDLTKDTFIWDRSMVEKAVMVKPVNNDFKFGDWHTIFVGHTQTTYLGVEDYKPLFACNVIDLDTGGGYDGKITIMNVDTKEYEQSDFATELYPNERGR